MVRGKGWYGNPHGHSLASRGISMKSNAVRLRSTKVIPTDEYQNWIKTVVLFMDEPEKSEREFLLERIKKKFGFFQEGVATARSNEEDRGDLSITGKSRETVEPQIGLNVFSAKDASIATPPKLIRNRKQKPWSKEKAAKAEDGWRALGMATYWLVLDQFELNETTAERYANAVGRFITDPDYRKNFRSEEDPDVRQFIAQFQTDLGLQGGQRSPITIRRSKEEFK